MTATHLLRPRGGDEGLIAEGARVADVIRRDAPAESVTVIPFVSPLPQASTALFVTAALVESAALPASPRAKKARQSRH
jgi:hypothetical protein